MKKSMLLSMLTFSAMAINLHAQTLEVIHQFQDDERPWTTYRGSGSYGMDYLDGIIHGSRFVINGDAVDVHDWQQKNLMGGYVADADDDYVVVLDGDYEDNRTWISSSVSLRTTKDGKLLWRKGVEGIDHLRVADLIKFAGTPAIAVQTSKGFDILDAKSGELLSSALLPSVIPAFKFTRWGTWVNYSRSELISGDAYTKVVFADSGVTYWAFPGGVVAATKGDQTLWTLDLNHRLNNSGLRESFTSYVSGIEALNERAIAVTFRTANDETFAPTVIIDTSNGAVLQNLPYASALAVKANTLYLRHRKSIAAYDTQAFAKLWETTGIKVFKDNPSFLLDGKYVYAVAASLEDEDDPRATGCANRRAQELVLLDKDTGLKLSRLKLSNQVGGLYFGSDPQSLVVDQASTRIASGDTPRCSAMRHALVVKVRS